jgi:RNase P subunit RPR2
MHVGVYGEWSRPYVDFPDAFAMQYEGSVHSNVVRLWCARCRKKLDKRKEETGDDLHDSSLLEKYLSICCRHGARLIFA